MCSSANPEGERECFVCGFIRDEAAELEDRLAREAAEREEARLAAIEAERAAEAERLRRAEEERRAEVARRLREEAARRAEDERRRREAAERAAEADRRRRAEEEGLRRAEADARERIAARERRSANGATFYFRILFFLSIGVFATFALFTQIHLVSRGEIKTIVYNFSAFWSHLGVGLSNLVKNLETNITPRFILDSHTKEILDTALASLNGRFTELGAVLLPLLRDKLFAAWAAVSTAAVGILAAAGRKFGDAASRLTLTLNTLSDSFALMWQRLGALLQKGGETVAEADGTVREAVNAAAENISKLKK